MSKRSPSPLVERHEGTHSSPETYTATWRDVEHTGLRGSLAVRFHGDDRASVSDVEGVASGRFAYRVRAYFVRTAAGWTLEDSRGVPAVYRAEELWTRPAPTIDAKIRAAAHGAVTLVANLWPDATKAAEVDRLTREHESARATAARLRAELAQAVTAERDAAELLAHAQRPEFADSLA